MLGFLIQISQIRMSSYQPGFIEKNKLNTLFNDPINYTVRYFVLDDNL